MSELNEIGNPPYKIEVSGTLNEYCAYQEIPRIGAHFYYGYPPENPPNWNTTNEGKLAKTTFDVKSMPVPHGSALMRDITPRLEDACDEPSLDKGTFQM